MKILLKLAYIGTAYNGWQAQNNGNTVQQRLTKAARHLFGFECDVTGCSRTDSGVHANGFYATVNERGKLGIETSVPTERIPRAINCFLPDDIAVISAEWVNDSFHARYDVKSKEYVYKIFTRHERDPFLADRVWHFPKKLDKDAMEQAARHFVGYHDFASFMAQGSKIVDTRRTVMSAAVSAKGNNVEFRVSADGFLYNMVRIMTGTLVEVGEGKIHPEKIPDIIAAHDRSTAGITAPACGLYLEQVLYK